MGRALRVMLTVAPSSCTVLRIMGPFLRFFFRAPLRLPETPLSAKVRSSSSVSRWITWRRNRGVEMLCSR